MVHARSWSVVATGAVLVLLAGGCGSEGPSASGTPTTDATVATTTTVTTPPPPDGFPAEVVTATMGNDLALPVLSAVDTSTGVSRQLVDVADLAPAFGFTPTTASIDGIDVSPDGSTVAFSVQAGAPPESAGRVFTVPLDGSAPAAPLPGTGDANVYTWSPDGRWLAVYDGALRLVPVGDESATSARRGIDLPYPPGAVVWGPDGTWLLEVPHGERTDCPDPVRVDIDPATGAMTEGPSSGRRDDCSGVPWIDQQGAVHRTTTEQVLGTDSTGRFVLGVQMVANGDPAAPGATWTARLVWWDAGDSVPAPLPLGIDLGPTVYDAAW